MGMCFPLFTSYLMRMLKNQKELYRVLTLFRYTKRVKNRKLKVIDNLHWGNYNVRSLDLLIIFWRTTAK